ncbi:MAG: hypothetical protein MUQ30_15690 [Anaerolineae bacterium]|nr:hypothetical protein [Anaerolineae bacterium]
MLWVSVPWELTPVHLLGLQDVTHLLQGQFSRGVRLFGRGDPAPALATVDQLSEVAAAQRDRYAGAPDLVLRADLLRGCCDGCVASVSTPTDAAGGNPHHQGEPGVGIGREGDLLIVETTGSSSALGELTSTSDKLFVRGEDDWVQFRASARRDCPGVGPAGSGLVGIPRLLIREGGAV